MNLINKVLAQQSGTNSGGGQFGSNGPGSSGLSNPLGSVASIQELIVKILNLVVQIGLPVIVLMIIYSGFKYVMARGNESEIKEAHKAILWTVIGAAIILGASVIAHAIQGTVDSLK